MAHHQHQHQHQQAFPNIPLKDMENSHPQDLFLFSAMYGQPTQSQVYLDDGLESILMDHEIGSRSRAMSSDFTLSPIMENPVRYSSNNGVGPLPPAPPLWRSAPLPSCVPAPVMKNSPVATKPMPASSSSGAALLSQRNFSFAHNFAQGDLPNKY